MCSKLVVVKVGFGETLDCEFATVLDLGRVERLVVELHGAEDVAILGKLWAGKDLSYEINDGVAAMAENALDPELGGRLEGGGGRGRAKGHETNELSLEETAFADEVARSEDVLYCGGRGGAVGGFRGRRGVDNEIGGRGEEGGEGRG